ncbi:MAG: response regulator [Bdellovibrio bacteriovorus]
MDPMKILLVDDSKSARYALRLQLQRHGVEVDTADSAESAFELLKGELPDAILMDHMMPGLNGFEALEVIREDPRTAHLPVVMCTSHEDADFAAAAERKGVVGILPKSGAPEKLPAILAKLRDTIQVPNLIPGQSPSAGGPQPRASKTEGTGGAAQPPRRPDSEEGHVDEAEVMARLDERIATRITALLDDLRRDLSERLMAEVQRLLDSGLQGERQVLEQRLTAERGTLDDRLEEGHRGLEATIETAMRAHETAAAEAREAQIHALSERLSKEVLPSLVKVELEAERGQIMDLVAQYLRELGPQLRGDEQREAQRIASLEGAMASKAAEIARREAEAAAESVLSRQRPQVEPAPPPRPAMTGIYLAILAAAIAGIGAAAAVYILVS